MRKRGRQRRPARRTPFKESKPLVLVVTEGSVTEPQYLNGFAKASKNPRVHIEVIGGAGVPKTIVESAKDLKRNAAKRARRESDENLDYDEVWCVFDVDQHPNISDARQMAEDNEMNLAISNPCIELWLWLHFAEQPGMQHQHDLQSMMKQHIPNYDKHVDYSDYAEGYPAAVKRASKLDDEAQAVNEDGRNPTTGIWRLTESICADA
ncbi:MAG: RloB family protein [Planctomycetota bacterium]|nr:RloB family protein [Planctomycetota bacterium]